MVFGATASNSPLEHVARSRHSVSDVLVAGATSYCVTESQDAMLEHLRSPLGPGAFDSYCSDVQLECDKHTRSDHKLGERASYWPLAHAL